MAKANPFRFSTKYQDDETDLLYYGYRYYDASLGRWISRDPIEQSSIQNLHSFVDNCPTSKLDIDGRMILRKFPKELQVPPVSGRYKDFDGLTWFESFSPKARANPGEGCCWKISLPGGADLYYWWVKGAPGGAPGESAKDHELQHVKIHEDVFNEFNRQGSAYVGVCFSKGKATCLRDLINNQLTKAWLAYNHTANVWHDCSRLGQRCDEMPGALQAEADAWQELAKEREKCEQMK